MSLSLGRERTRQGVAQWASAALVSEPELAPARGICAEVIVLFLVCTLDMLSSAWLFHHGLAVEGNPVLRGFAEAGLFPFVGAKLASFLPALMVAEWYRRIRPRRARLLLRGAIVGYVGIYTLAVAGQFAG